MLTVGGGHQRQVHHGVDVEVDQEAAERVEAEADPLDVGQQVGQLRVGWGRVDPDDAFDARVGGEPGGDVRAEVATDAGDDDDPRGTGGATEGHVVRLARQAGSSRDVRGLIT